MPLRKPVLLTLAVVMIVPIGLIGCGHSEPRPDASSQSQPIQSEAKRYQLEGTVVSIDRQQKRLVIDGKDIPGFMAAMTMPYPVADDQTLDRVQPGDQVTADVVAAGSDYHLDNVVVVKRGNTQK